MYFLGILQDISDAIYQGIRTLLGYLMAVIYTLIEFFYEVFEIVSRAEILRNEFIQDIYYRVGLILGLFMIFKLTFSLIQSLIDPDKINDKKNGVLNIVKRSIISIILLGSTPYIFSGAMEIQKLVIGTDASDNILYKLIANNKTNSVGKTGAVLASDLYFEFFRDDESPKIDGGVEDYIKTCNNVPSGSYCNRFVETNIDTIKKDVTESTLNFFDTVAYLSLKENDSNDYVIEFDWGGLLGIIVGAFVLYMIFMYCVQTAIRVIQLAYLQLIAPIPILSYISNPDGSFKNWGSQCISTYLDLFIRLIIIYFTMTMINEVLVMLGDIDSVLMTSTGLSGSDNFILKLTVKIFIILGLLLFAQKAPDLIKEIFPSFGGAAGLGFGLKMPKEAKGLATFGLGAGIGAVAGAATGIKYGAGTKGGRIGGALTGLVRGGLGGAKTKGNIFKNVSGGMANQRSAMQRAYNRNNDGSTFWGRTIGAGDAARTKAAFDEELALYDAYDQNTKIIDAELEKNSMVQSAMAKKQALMERYQRGGATPTAAEIKQADDLIKQAKKTALQVEIGRGPTGKLKAALDNAEAIREKGARSGYSGFGTTSISTGTAADRAQAYNDNKDSIQDGTRSIKDPAGSRNKAYKEAEANAKYAKNK